MISDRKFSQKIRSGPGEGKRGARIVEALSGVKIERTPRIGSAIGSTGQIRAVSGTLPLETAKGRETMNAATPGLVAARPTRPWEYAILYDHNSLSLADAGPEKKTTVIMTRASAMIFFFTEASALSRLSTCPITRISNSPR